MFKFIDFCLTSALIVARWSCAYVSMLLVGSFVKHLTGWSTMDIYMGLVCVVIGFLWDTIAFAIQTGWNVKTWNVVVNILCLGLSYWVLPWMARMTLGDAGVYFVMSLFFAISLSIASQAYLRWLFINKRSLFKLFSHNAFETADSYVHVMEYELEGTLSTHLDVTEYIKKD